MIRKTTIAKLLSNIGENHKTLLKLKAKMLQQEKIGNNVEALLFIGKDSQDAVEVTLTTKEVLECLEREGDRILRNTTAEAQLLSFSIAEEALCE
jgi:hypothetical protein